MRLYLEPSVLVKLFKREEDSDKMIEVISRMDGHRAWSAYTSNWTLLEVTRALRKAGKPKELIDLNLKELRSHNIKFQALGREIMAEAETIIAGNNVYASDSVHVATFRNLKRRYRLDAFLTFAVAFVSYGRAKSSAVVYHF